MKTWGLLISTLVLILSQFSNDIFAQNGFNRIYGGPGGEQAYAVRQTYDGGYIFTGFTTSYGSGYNDIWLVKLRQDGDTLWTKKFGGPFGEGASCVIQTSDGGYFISANVSSSSRANDGQLLIKTDSQGDTLWTRRFGGETNDWASDGFPTADGGFILSGYTDSFGAQGRDAWIIKTDASGYVTALPTHNSRAPRQFQLMQNYPNPFNPVTTINYEIPITNYVELIVFNLVGQNVTSLVNEKQAAGKYSVEWDAAGLASGIYYYQLTAGEYNDVKKMILLR